VEHGSDAATPRTSRGERTRARLLQATRAAIAERGYVAARVEDIVALAGVSHGTFYTYFENKAAALDALIDATASELQAVVDEPWDGPDGTAAIEAVIGRFVAVFATHAAVVRAWLEASAHDAHFATRLREVRGGYVHRVAEVLAPALAGTGHDPSLAATSLVAMVEGAVTQGVADRGPIGQGELVRTLRSLWVGGVVRLSEDEA
jgi:AcrR family transcriptional regulator